MPGEPLQVVQAEGLEVLPGAAAASTTSLFPSMPCSHHTCRLFPWPYGPGLLAAWVLTDEIWESDLGYLIYAVS